ncbi:MAG: Uma2 family endonuclease [Pyrinomonadaceae bacterium]
MQRPFRELLNSGRLQVTDEIRAMVAQPLYSSEAYLAFERSADERHEFLDGFIYAMAGETPSHADISANLVGLLHERLRDSPCRVRTKDTKVRSGPHQVGTMKGLFSYPDAVVICGEPEYLDQHRDVVVNPTVIFEVLSETTEARDRGVKFHRYQAWSPTLTDYVLVSQVAPSVDYFHREADGSWSYHIHIGLDETFTIQSIDCTLKLLDIYARITFPPESEEDFINEPEPS